VLTVLDYCIIISIIFALMLLFLDLFVLLHVNLICTNKYLLIYFRLVGLYSHCIHGTTSQCIGSGVLLPMDPKLPV